MTTVNHPAHKAGHVLDFQIVSALLRSLWDGDRMYHKLEDVGLDPGGQVPTNQAATPKVPPCSPATDPRRRKPYERTDLQAA